MSAQPLRGGKTLALICILIASLAIGSSAFATGYQNITVTNTAAGSQVGTLSWAIKRARRIWGTNHVGVAINLNPNANQPVTIKLDANLPDIESPVYVYTVGPVVVDFQSRSRGFVIKSNHVRINGTSSASPDNDVTANLNAKEYCLKSTIRLINFNQAGVQVECGSQILISGLQIECNNLSNGIVLANTTMAKVIGNEIYSSKTYATTSGGGDPVDQVSSNGYSNQKYKSPLNSENPAAQAIADAEEVLESDAYKANVEAVMQLVGGSQDYWKKIFVSFKDWDPKQQDGLLTELKAKGVSEAQFNPLVGISDPVMPGQQAIIGHALNGILVRQWDCTPCTNIEAQQKASYDQYPSSAWVAGVADPWCKDYPCMFSANTALGSAYPNQADQVVIEANRIGYKLCAGISEVGSMNIGIQLLGGKNTTVNGNQIAICLEAGISVNSAESALIESNCVGVNLEIGLVRPSSLGSNVYWLNTGVLLGCDNGQIVVKDNKVGGFQEGIKSSFGRCGTQIRVREDEAHNLLTAYQIQGNFIGGTMTGQIFANRIGYVADRPINPEGNLCEIGTTLLKDNKFVRNQYQAVLLADKTGVQLTGNTFYQNGNPPPTEPPLDPVYIQEKSVKVDELSAATPYPLTAPIIEFSRNSNPVLLTPAAVTLPGRNYTYITIEKIGVAQSGTLGTFRAKINTSSITQAGKISLYLAKAPGDAEQELTIDLAASGAHFDFPAPAGGSGVFAYITANLTSVDANGQQTTSEFAIPRDLRLLCPPVDFVGGASLLELSGVNPRCPTTEIPAPEGVVASCLGTAGDVNLIKIKTNLDPTGANNATVNVIYRIKDLASGNYVTGPLSPPSSAGGWPIMLTDYNCNSCRGLGKFIIEATLTDGDVECSIIKEITVDLNTTVVSLVSTSPVYCEQPRAGLAKFQVAHATDAQVYVASSATEYASAQIIFSQPAGTLSVSNLEPGSYVLKVKPTAGGCDACEKTLPFQIQSQDLTLAIGQRIVALPCRSGHYVPDGGGVPAQPASICNNPPPAVQAGQLLINFAANFAVPPSDNPEYIHYNFLANIVDEDGNVIQTATACHNSTNDYFTVAELAQSIPFRVLSSAYSLAAGRTYKVLIEVYGKKHCDNSADVACGEFILLCKTNDYFRTVPMDLQLQVTNQQWIQDGVAQFLVCPNGFSYNTDDNGTGPGPKIADINLKLSWNPVIPSLPVSSYNFLTGKVLTDNPGRLSVDPATVTTQSISLNSSEINQHHANQNPAFNPTGRYRYQVTLNGCTAHVDVAVRQIKAIDETITNLDDPRRNLVGLEWVNLPGCSRPGEAFAKTDGTASMVTTQWWVSGALQSNALLSQSVTGFEATPTGGVGPDCSVAVAMRLKEGRGECLVAPDASLLPLVDNDRISVVPACSLTVQDPRAYLPVVTALIQPVQTNSILPSKAGNRLSDCSIAIQSRRNPGSGQNVDDLAAKLLPYGSLNSSWQVNWFDQASSTIAATSSVMAEIDHRSGSEGIVLESVFPNVGDGRSYTVTVIDLATNCIVSYYQDQSLAPHLTPITYHKPGRNRYFAVLAGWGAAAPQDNPMPSVDISSLAAQMGDALDDSKQKCLDRSAQQGLEVAKGITDGRYVAESANFEMPPLPDNFTLFYYDRADRLVATIPPEGVVVKSTTESPTTVGTGGTITVNHRLATYYTYDMLGNRIGEKTPDAALKRFAYDNANRLRYAQTGRQAASPARASYLRYDNFGRIIESGEASLPANATFASYASNAGNLADPPVVALGQVWEYTKTQYDQPATALPAAPMNGANPDVQGESNWTAGTQGLGWLLNTSGSTSNYVRNRIAYTESWQKDGPSGGWRTITGYAYDPHGNVKRLYQALPYQSPLSVAYTYDLVSGKVRTMTQAEGTPHQFLRRFGYDADQRLVTVESSREGYLWTNDANYQYLPTGQLARLELGAQKVQGLDFAYTVNGWLKSINGTGEGNTDDGSSSTSTGSGTGFAAPASSGGGGGTGSVNEPLILPSRSLLGPSLNDPGRDGETITGRAIQTAPDAFSMRLDYFLEDFKLNFGSGTDYDRYAWLANPAGTAVSIGSHQNPWLSPLYDGNIASWGWSTQGLSSASANESLARREHYRYDRSGRLVLSQAATAGLARAVDIPSASTWGASSAYLYPSGTGGAFATRYQYDRSGNIKSLERKRVDGTEIDKLSYTYPVTAGRKTANRLTSVDDQATGAAAAEGAGDAFYTYDDDGNLITDGTHTLTWNGRGKVAKVVPTTPGMPSSYYLYDGLNNKAVRYTAATSPNVEWHLLDGSGQGLAVLSGSQTQLTTAEVRLTGTDALGTLALSNLSASPVDLATASGTAQSDEEDKKAYELRDHLGNVRSTVSGLRLFDNTARISLSSVSGAKEYYPFGSIARQYGPQGYRWGYNGQEIINDGQKIHLTARFWEYDPLIARRWNLDPIWIGSESRYAVFGNNPVALSDRDGDFKTKLGAFFYKITHGGAIDRDTKSGQWFVGKEVKYDGEGIGVAAQRRFGWSGQNKPVDFGGRNPFTPWDIGVEWLSGTGNRSQNFKEGDSFTELYKRHEHVQETKQMAANQLKATNGTNISPGRNNYGLSGIEGVGKYIQDYSTLLTAGAIGNIAYTYLGSHQLTYTITSVDVANRTAQVHFVAHNSSTLQSATRPPVIGYQKWWQESVGKYIDDHLKSGPMSKTEQTIEWTENIDW